MTKILTLREEYERVAYEIKIKIKIKIKMYITTQVANWLTKRFWSNQAGDLSLMQLAVVGMTLAMGLMVATNW